MASDEQDRAEKRRQEILKQMGFDDESLRKSMEAMQKMDEQANAVRWIGFVFAIITALQPSISRCHKMFSIFTRIKMMKSC